MGKKAELIKDSMFRIRRLELALQQEPESKAIKELLQEEKDLIQEIEKAR